MRLAVIDTETTGLDIETSAVLEFACLQVDCHHGAFSTSVKITDSYSTKIKPTPNELALADPKALELNGYTQNASEWESAPSLTEVGPKIVECLKGRVLVGHNVAFDEAMLRFNLSAHGVPGKVPYRKIDTQVLVMEHLFPLGLKRTSLDSTREFLSWSKEGAHTALKDAQDALQLFELTWRMGWLRKLSLAINTRLR